MANLFVDVSSWNLDTPDYFDAIKNWGAKSVVVKVSEGGTGTKYVNPKARRQKELSEERGMIAHAYHYFLGVSEDDARGEARYFVEQARAIGFDPEKTVMCIDVEDPSLTTNRQTLTNYVNAFNDEVYRLGYHHIATYTGRYWAQTRIYMEQLHATDHWIAEYGSSQCNTRCDQWQYDSTTKFCGNATDTNYDYNGFLTTPLNQASAPPVAEQKPDAGQSKPSNESWVDELGVRWYKETGKFTITTPEGIWLRWGASTASAKIAVLPKGSAVKYDAFCHSGGYVWIRQPRGNGSYAYLPTGESRNGKRVSSWGTFSEQ